MDIQYLFTFPIALGLSLLIIPVLIRHSAKLCDAAGAAQWTNGDGDFLAAEAGALPGDTRQFQIFYRNVQSTCGAGFNTTNATEVTFGL